MIHSLKEVLDSSIEIGKIVGTHGLDGEVKIKLYANYDVMEVDHSYMAFNSSRRRSLLLRAVNIKSRGDKLIVRFDGFDSIEDARKLKDFELFMNLDELPELKNGEYYFYQILNSRVYNENGDLLGVVMDIIETGSADVVSVFPEGSDIQEDKDAELLIPLTKEYLRELDPLGKKITVRLPKYMDSEESDEK